MKQLHISNHFAALSADFYTRLQMQGLQHEVELLHVNPHVAALLGLRPEQWQSDEFLAIMSGQADLPGGKTLAAVYSGHQFGQWAGQLGDGRAHLLGAIELGEPARDLFGSVASQLWSANTNYSSWEVQLKGSGLTPYSRHGDGRAVLRSSVREYLCSAAMDGLGIPTTLALSITMSQDRVRRERMETAAIVSRVSPSFVRFGSFQHWYANQRPELLRELLNYVCDTFFVEELASDYPNEEAKILAFMDIVIRRTAHLIALWQSVGFVHGVMNTDNMSVLGLTIDYGPFGFMEDFNPNWVINRTDTTGRYAFSQQPTVALWNLYQLAQCFTLLGVRQEALREGLDRFEDYFYEAFYSLHAKKLGLSQITDDDDDLVNDFWSLMATQSADFTLAFRRLSCIDEDVDSWLSLFSDRKSAQAWLTRYQQRLQHDPMSTEVRQDVMNRHNPLYILRTRMAQEAIDTAQQGDHTVLDRLIRLLQQPYIEHGGAEAYAEPRDRATPQQTLSCSS